MPTYSFPFPRYYPTLARPTLRPVPTPIRLLAHTSSCGATTVVANTEDDTTPPSESKDESKDDHYQSPQKPFHPPTKPNTETLTLKVKTVECPTLRPIEPDNCCMSGCVNCVWDTYREEIEAWSAANKAQDSLANLPVGMREFMALEKRVSERSKG